MTRLASRLGPLELENGYPTDATVAKIFDDIDYQRACQAYLWALPLMAMQQWQSEHLIRFGAGKLDYVDYLTFQDKLGLLTANAATPYIMAFPNLKETGPLVFEVPSGPTAGGFTDFWQRPITDSGQTGPDKCLSEAQDVFEVPWRVTSIGCTIVSIVTLAEIESAAAGLSPAEKQELMLFLASRLRAEGAPLPEPRTFTPNEMAGWIAEDEADMRRLRERP